MGAMGDGKRGMGNDASLIDVGGGGRERGELESYPPLFFFLKRWECL